jgi:hypothetical protein
LKVNNVVIWARGDDDEQRVPTLAPKLVLSGRAWTINYGPKTAHIRRSHCIPFWGPDELPMAKPYRRTQPSEDNRLRTPPPQRVPEPRWSDVRIDELPWAEKLGPREVAFWAYETTVPRNYGFSNELPSLYVMGFIEYNGVPGAPRAVFFARKYDPSKGRFTTVEDNPDYETEE